MALDWLKPILGDTYSDELDGKISAEIGKHFVSREDFNVKKYCPCHRTRAAVYSLSIL